MADIDFTTAVNACGRNGLMQQKGLHVNRLENTVTLFPVNTRGIGHGWIQIPLQDIDKVIKALGDCKNA